MIKPALINEPAANSVECNSSFLYIEVKPHWAREVFEWATAWLLVVLLGQVWISVLVVGKRTVLNTGLPTGGRMLYRSPSQVDLLQVEKSSNEKVTTASIQPQKEIH